LDSGDPTCADRVDNELAGFGERWHGVVIWIGGVSEADYLISVRIRTSLRQVSASICPDATLAAENPFCTETHGSFELWPHPL